MKYTEENILHSASGYCMPFEEPSKDVELSLGYGEQKHPVTGESFFHHGIDFNVSRYLLSAVADGTVSAVGSDVRHGICQTVRYGKYEVTYAHLSNVMAHFGQPVKAGQPIAVSGDMLHMEVRFDDEELNPIEFLTMQYANVKAMQQEELLTFEMTIPSPYDTDRKEIESLMMRFLPLYFNDLQHGDYRLPNHTEQSLRNVFTQASARNYFFETMPSMANPLGIGNRCMPLAAKVQHLLIEDFLHYLAMRHDVYLSTVSEEVKKKPVQKQ